MVQSSQNEWVNESQRETGTAAPCGYSPLADRAWDCFELFSNLSLTQPVKPFRAVGLLGKQSPRPGRF